MLKHILSARVQHHPSGHRFRCFQDDPFVPGQQITVMTPTAIQLQAHGLAMGWETLTLYYDTSRGLYVISEF